MWCSLLVLIIAILPAASINRDTQEGINVLKENGLAVEAVEKSSDLNNATNEGIRQKVEEFLTPKATSNTAPKPNADAAEEDAPSTGVSGGGSKENPKMFESTPVQTEAESRNIQAVNDMQESIVKMARNVDVLKNNEGLAKMPPSTMDPSERFKIPVADRPTVETVSDATSKILAGPNPNVTAPAKIPLPEGNVVERLAYYNPTLDPDFVATTKLESVVQKVSPFVTQDLLDNLNESRYKEQRDAEEEKKAAKVFSKKRLSEKYLEAERLKMDKSNTTAEAEPLKESGSYVDFLKHKIAEIHARKEKAQKELIELRSQKHSNDGPDKAGELAKGLHDSVIAYSKKDKAAEEQAVIDQQKTKQAQVLVKQQGLVKAIKNKLEVDGGIERSKEFPTVTSRAPPVAFEIPNLPESTRTLMDERLHAMQHKMDKQKELLQKEKLEYAVLMAEKQKSSDAVDQPAAELPTVRSPADLPTSLKSPPLEPEIKQPVVEVEEATITPGAASNTNEILAHLREKEDKGTYHKEEKEDAKVEGEKNEKAEKAVEETRPANKLVKRAASTINLINAEKDSDAKQSVAEEELDTGSTEESQKQYHDSIANHRQAKLVSAAAAADATVTLAAADASAKMEKSALDLEGRTAALNNLLGSVDSNGIEVVPSARRNATHDGVDAVKDDDTLYPAMKPLHILGPSHAEKKMSGKIEVNHHRHHKHIKPNQNPLFVEYNNASAKLADANAVMSHQMKLMQTRKSHCPAVASEAYPTFEKQCIHGQASDTPTENITKPSEPGMYRCGCCGQPLFRSDQLDDAHDHHLVFEHAIDHNSLHARPDPVTKQVDLMCNKCHVHLGHVQFENQMAEEQAGHASNNAYAVNPSCVHFHSTVVKPKPHVVTGWMTSGSKSQVHMLNQHTH